MDTHENDQINRDMMMLHTLCTPMCNVSDLTCYTICEQSHLSHLILGERKIFGLCLPSGDVFTNFINMRICTSFRVPRHGGYTQQS